MDEVFAEIEDVEFDEDDGVCPDCDDEDCPGECADLDDDEGCCPDCGDADCSGECEDFDDD